MWKPLFYCVGMEWWGAKNKSAGNIGLSCGKWYSKV